MEIFNDSDEGATAALPSGTRSTIAPLLHVSVPETRKITQTTGHVPKSAILTDLEDKKKIGVCRALTKDIPKKLQRDFFSGKKNSVTCLHEVSQLSRWDCKYVESTPSTTFDDDGDEIFAMTAIVNGIKYVAGEGKRKQIAKACTATHALNEIFGHDAHREREPRDVDGLVHYYDTYGRTVLVLCRNAASDLSEAKAQRRQKPKPVVPQKTNFPSAPSRSREAMEIPKQKSLTHEIVGTLVERVQNALSAANCHKFSPVFQGAVAAFVVRKVGFPDEVVSLGTGDMCFHGGELHTDGRVVFDCHAETVARRGFRRYLLKQIQQWYSGDETLRENCILEKTKDSDLLCVKEEVSVHLYLSKLPKGMARSQRNVAHVALLDECNLPSLRNSGSVEIKMTSGIPIEVTASSVLGMEKRTMLTMSGSDKILKWNICGVQGSLLSLFIKSVCLTSITVGYDGCNGDTDSLNVAVNKRLDDALNSHLPGVFFVNHVLKIGSYAIKETVSVDSMLGGRENLSVNWTTGDAAIEVLNAETGILDKSSPSSQSAEGVSRISKMAFYAACLKMSADYLESSVLQPHENYHTAKISCESYRKAKRIFFDHLEKKGLGHWVVRPKQVDCFDA